MILYILKKKKKNEVNIYIYIGILLDSVDRT